MRFFFFGQFLFFFVQFSYAFLHQQPKSFNLNVNKIASQITRTRIELSINSHNKLGPHEVVEGSAYKTFDPQALLSYVGATGLEWTLIVSTLHLIQFGLLNSIKSLILPFPTKYLERGLVALLFLSLALRSRIFSPLDNSRPQAKADDPVFKNRLRPWWQPPPLVFPIVWSTITILRTISSTMIYATKNTLLCYPIFALIAHLSLGDTWNTINNVDNRLGTSFLFVLSVLLSSYLTIYLYFQTLPLAAKILAFNGIWLTIATFLVYSIWQINSKPFNKPSFWPSKQEGPSSPWKIPILKNIKLF